jgi:predicted nucleotidyltransferase
VRLGESVLTIKPSRKYAENLRKKYREIVEEVIREFKRQSGIIAVLLSGSVAREDYTPYSDIEFNVVVDKASERKFKDEDLWRSRNIRGVFVEIYYGSLESWKKRLLSQKEEPRCLNQFFEAKILHDSNGAAKYLVNLAKEVYSHFTYPPQCMKLAQYALRHNKNKILSDLYHGKKLVATMDADFATGWVLRSLAYTFNIPNTEWSRNLEKILTSRHLTDEFKKTLILAIRGSSKQRVQAAIHLSDLYLRMSLSEAKPRI